MENQKLPTWVKVQALPGTDVYELFAPIYTGELVNITAWAESCGMTFSELIDALQDMAGKDYVSVEFFAEKEVAL
jgi:hypothetical protein